MQNSHNTLAKQKTALLDAPGVHRQISDWKFQLGFNILAMRVMAYSNWVFCKQFP
jgi:hypothetical protein